MDKTADTRRFDKVKSKVSLIQRIVSNFVLNNLIDIQHFPF